jgi:hypothetical protein
MRAARINWGNPTRHSSDILHKAKGDHLDQVHSDQKVLATFRRGSWSLLSEAKSLKTSSRDHKVRVNSDQMALVMASQEAGLCE